MKKFLALILTVVFLFSLSACDNYAGYTDKNSTPAQNTPSDNQSTSTPSKSNVSNSKITRDRAIEIALAEAKLQRVDIRDLEAELDYERSTLVWEVDFDHKNLEYSYDVNAETGDISKVERERD